MFDSRFLKSFEKKIIEDKLNIDFIKNHYKSILQMINPIVIENKIILNDYQYKLMIHLFNICYQVEYVPSL
jgi:hypothetical protein